MANPNDIPLEVFRTGMQAALRGTLLMLERQQRLLAFQLKAVDQAIAGSKEIVNEVSHAGTVADLAALPAALMRQQTEQYTRLCEEYTALASHNQAELAEHLREAGDSWQKLQGNATAGPQFAMPMPAPVQEWFDRFGQFNSVLTNAFLQPNAAHGNGAAGHEAAARARSRRGE
ncbi:hypothetical protein BKK81_10180 [Cupriavidus sp. USMAHM13]|uniref:Phasin domain-containing protein n=1 Tax=Cupriavidus malaysiensis TaxID=367825 RepID=A0ABM6F458_9BURK|nr:MULTISPECIES: phasin family protein [Cupriavidus]AOY99589.1 hypothetical protein BKK81_10180 [Cupriavidus sp. USMAHM13]AOZ06237.1 hypothetical protein BKK80_10620 [Cupriavidus malaysiensis]